MKRMAALFGLLVLTLLTDAPARATEPEGLRVDRTGDQLPSGVVARLGSLRFRLESEKPVTISLRAKIAVGPSASGLELCVYDLTTGKLLRRIATYNRRQARELYLDPVGRIVFVEGKDADLTMYDVRSGVYHGELPVKLGDTRIHRQLSFSADGTRVALFEGSQGEYIASVWEPATKRKIASLKFTATESPRVVLSADGLVLAVCEDARFVFHKSPVLEAQRTVHLWDVEADKEVRRITLDDAVVNAALSPDGLQLAVVERDAHLSLWDVESGKRIRRQSVPDGTGEALLFSPDGQHLAAATYSYTERNTVLLWKTDSGKLIEVHKPPVDRSLRVFFQDDGTLLATGRGWDEHHLRLWEPKSGRPHTAGDGHGNEIFSLAYRRDGKTLFSTTFDEFRAWDVAKGTSLRCQVLPSEDRGNYSPYAIVTPDGSYVLKTKLTLDRIVKVISTEIGEEIGSLRNVELQEHHPVAVGATRCVGSNSGRVSVWDLQQCREIRRMDIPGADGGPLALTPDGRFFALATRLPVDPKRMSNGNAFEYIVYKYELSFWNVAGKRRWKQSLGLMEARRLVFSPDASLLAVWVTDGVANVLRVLETATGREVRSLSLPPDNDELAFAPSNHHDLFLFSPDGRTLAVVEGKRQESCPAVVGLWELATGKKRGELSLPRGRVTALAFSPDGPQLATGLRDGAILLWDTTGRADAKTRVNVAPTEEEFTELWAVLDGDASAAYRAIQRLSAHPMEAAAFLRKHLLPVKEKPPSGQTIRRWIADLDHDDFARREQASHLLIAFDQVAEAEVIKALKQQQSLETHRRLEEARETMRSRMLRREQIRPARALEALERADTPETRQLLEELAQGQAYTWLTREAKAALKRLDAR